MHRTSCCSTKATRSRRPLKAILAAAALAAVSGCGPKAPEGIDVGVLDEAVGSALGDPTLCVMIVKRGSGQVVYRYGTHMNCAVSLPSCEGGGETHVEAVAKAAAKGATKSSSCPTTAGRVGWTAGPLPTSKPDKYGDLAYAAAMNSQRGLPGMEMGRRLERAFAKAGF